jgi:hypothetical protein
MVFSIRITNTQGLISLIVIWSRVLSVKKFLRTMPKPYIPIRQVDVSKVGWPTGSWMLQATE